MIHYALVCDDGHDFDGWFRDSETFESQSLKTSRLLPLLRLERMSRAR